MLELQIEPVEFFDEATETFKISGEESLTVCLEHSLVSLSKWESIHQKPFLTNTGLTVAEILSYIKCMIVNDVNPSAIEQITNQQMQMIMEYVDSPQSATKFGKMPKKHGPSEIVTAELIYYWLIAFSIPFECQHWHLNRLFSLIKICNSKNQKPEKMSRSELAQRNRELNEQRRRELGTKG